MFVRVSVSLFMCVDIIMFVVCIYSDADESHAYSLLTSSGKNNVWIGLNDISTNGVYEWSDSSSYDYDSFAPGEPQDSTSENCVCMGTGYSGDWIDTGCDGNDAISAWLCNVNVSTSHPTLNSTTPRLISTAGTAHHFVVLSCFVVCFLFWCGFF